MSSIGSNPPSPSKVPELLKSDKDDDPKFDGSYLLPTDDDAPSMEGELKVAEANGEYPELWGEKLDEENKGDPIPEDVNDEVPLDGEKDPKFDVPNDEDPKFDVPKDADPKFDAV